ncbi:MAG: chloride channel protein [Planctomycetota bacterium]
MKLQKLLSMGDTPEIRNLVRLLGLCILIGLVAGLGAVAFFTMLEAGSSFFMGYLANYHATGPTLEEPLFEIRSLHGGTGILRWAFFIIPAVGGLLSGWLIFTFAPEAEGHGTDAAIQVYHFRSGIVRKRVPFIKALTAMITIGTGGSGGREGPIAQIGSGFGSILGRWFSVSPDQRRIMMAAGMSAGIGAIFHAPLAGALFAAEVLYRGPDLEHEVFVPAFVTSIVAYSVFSAIFGFHPLFWTPDYVFDQPVMLLPYLMLAIVVALGARLYVRVFYGVRHFMFGRVHLPNHLKPAIGGLLTGIVGFFLPEALGAGYGVVQACFNMDAGKLPAIMELPTASIIQSLLPGGLGAAWVAAIILALIALAKMGTTAFSIGSGGSGGVFGPAIVIGGALGGATGLICQQVFPDWPIQPGAFALVGMAGFFAGAANTPISTIIMVSEMTGNYHLLVPSMLVCIVSYVLCRRFTLYEEQLPSRLDAPSKLGNMAGAILRRLTVDQALVRRFGDDLTLVSQDMGFRDLVQRYTMSTQACFPMVDEDNALVGVIDAQDIRRVVAETGIADLIIARDIGHPATTVTVEDSLLSAINNMVRTGEHELVVVDAKSPGEIIGTLSRGDIIAAYNRQIVDPTD